MSPLLKQKSQMLSKDEFKLQANKVIEWIDRYFEQLESYPVKSNVKPSEIYDQLPTSAPLNGESFDDIISDVDKIIMPGITHWQHPNFHAYFPANGSLESLFAEFITAAIGAQCMIWDTSPAAAELEQRVMEWLMEIMGIPSHFEGVIQDTASSATLVAILTAREVKTDFKSNEEGVPNGLRIYCSKETHSSIDKAVGISGIGKKNLIKIGGDGNLRMDPEALEVQIKEDIGNGLIPTCVIVSIGTTGTVAADPLRAIALICEQYKVWCHVDAAYAGTALFLPEYRWLIDGIEKADSFVFNPHKWMFTNFDCSAYFVKDAKSLIRTFEVLPEYLKTKTRNQVNDYRDWGIPLGRRFRALKLWFVIRSYGVIGIQKKLRFHIQLNTFFAKKIKSLDKFELIQEPFLNFTCFRFKPKHISDLNQLNTLNEALLEKINAKGVIFLSHTKIKEVYVIRIVIGQTYIGQRHVETAIAELINNANTLIINQ